MIEFLPYIVVFVLAVALSIAEVLFGKFHLNYSLVLKKPKFIIYYGLFYGIVGGLVLLLIRYSELKINDVEVCDAPFIVAIIIGLTIKPISRANLYTITSGDKQFHVGFKQISGFFDNLALKRINDIVDEEIIRKVKEVKSQLNQESAGTIDRLIQNSLPTDLLPVKKVTFMKEITEAKDKFDKLRYFAVKFGVHKLDTLLLMQGEEEE